MEEKVIYLYYTNKMLQKDIAEKLNISKSTICRIIKKDQRYEQEKENRKRLNRIKRNKDIQRRVECNRKKAFRYSNIEKNARTSKFRIIRR